MFITSQWLRLAVVASACAGGRATVPERTVLADKVEAYRTERRIAPPNDGVSAAEIENDLCEGALDIAEQSVPFSTVGATTDGLPIIGVCFDSGFPQITSDIWYCYTASADGIATVQTCSAADFDTKIAVYDGCGCPPEKAITCDDDDCVQALRSTANFVVTAGGEYLIRVGGFPTFNDQGTGELVVSLIEAPCGNPGSGDCFDPDNDTPGCVDFDCCNAVCVADTFCCEREWDSICAEEANGFCGDGFTECGTPGAGDCSASNGSPGCDNVACCQAVCEEDTLCCTNTWDARCATEAETTVECLCGPGREDCFAAHTEGGCQQPTCCAAVCENDPQCCISEWSEQCANQAGLLAACNPKVVPVDGRWPMVIMILLLVSGLSVRIRSAAFLSRR